MSTGFQVICFFKKIWFRHMLSLRRLYYRLLSLVFGLQFNNFDRHKNYSDYVDKQKEKTLNPDKINKWLGEEWQVKLDGFLQLFERNQQFVSLSSNCLCLGARTGQEVKALHLLGKDAIGVDLVEFPPLTVFGDIHDLQFDNESFDLVFTNIFDHSLYPEKFVAEMERVCSANGHIIINLQLYTKGDDYAENIVYSPQYVCNLFQFSDVVISRNIFNSFDEMNWEIVMRKMS